MSLFSVVESAVYAVAEINTKKPVHDQHGLFIFSLAIVCIKLLTNVDTFAIIIYYIIIESGSFPYTSRGDSRTPFKWYKLAQAVEHYGYDWGADHAHDSLADAKATAFLWRSLNAD